MSDSREFEGNSLPKDSGDLFGFAALAERVSSAVLEQAGNQCFVLGLEGEWGSGKSSLLAMLHRRLEEQGAPVMRFEPWMVGPREALIAELLSGLNAAVEKLNGGTATVKVDSIAEQLRKYAGGVAALGRVAGLAGTLGIPLVSVAGAALTKTAEVLKEGLGNTPLSTLKDRSGKALEKLPARIIVLIDDIDRLEPKEAVEVLRLVQSVADFPNITYVLCYDRARLAESITKVTGLEDGAAYLEKIIQVVFTVPRPQRSALRHMFIIRLKAVTGRTDFDKRLSNVILDHVGPRSRTPRAIVRVLDGLRLLWPALANDVDLADLVWLQFIRNEDVQIYRWIEEYVAETAEPPSTEPELSNLQTRFEGSLEALISPTRPSGMKWQELRAFLPMVSADSDSFKDALFVKPSQYEALQAYNSKRLSSPDHGRLYFGLLRPEGAMTDTELVSFLESCRDPKHVAAEMLRLGQASSRAGLTRLEIILDQLGIAIERLDDAQIQGLVRGLLSVVDELTATALVADRTVFRGSLGRLLADLSTGRDGAVWSAWLQAAMAGAKAVNFITGEFEIEGRQVSLNWAGDDLSAILHYLAAQYRKATLAGIVNGGGPIKVFKIWYAADPSEVEAFLEQVLSNDELFVLLVVNLYHKGTTVSDLKEIGYLISQKAFEDHLDEERLTSRLETLVLSATGKQKEELMMVLDAL